MVAWFAICSNSLGHQVVPVRLVSRDGEFIAACFDLASLVSTGSSNGELERLPCLLPNDRWRVGCTLLAVKLPIGWAKLVTVPLGEAGATLPLGTYLTYRWCTGTWRFRERDKIR